MEKINIAELLKDCPQGMELDCILFNNPVKYESANDDGSYPISIRTEEGELFYLNKYGCLYDRFDSKCAIFPKGKTTWDGFVPPCRFKDGDIVYIKTNGYTHNELIIIFKEIKNDHIHRHACFAYQVLYTSLNAVCHLVDVEIMRLATEEEKQQLFDAIKENGYKWNAETKTLDKLPKFKVGDKVRYKNNHNVIFTITSLEEDYYGCGIANAFCFEDQDDYELVQNKFDITTLKPFESRVLVRDTNGEKWKSNFWGFYDSDHAINHPHECCGNTYRQCIPYEGNEHLLGKKDDCDEYYKTWE